jgi:hypothetical protein
MKLPKYADVVKFSDEEQAQNLAPLRASRARKQAELEMAKLEEEVATKEAQLYEKCCEKEVDFRRIIDLQDDLALVNRKKEQYKKILEEMFPDS